MKTKGNLFLVLVLAMVKAFLCISMFLSVLILAMIQDQALVASRSKHFLIETEDKTPSHTDYARDVNPPPIYDDYPWEHGSDGFDYYAGNKELCTMCG